MNWAALIWLALMVIFIGLENTTVSLVSIWFVLGALVSMIVALLHGEIWLQIVVFVVVSVLCLALLRPVLRKYFVPKLTKTNVDSVIGCTGVVIHPIDNIAGVGNVKLGGMEWSARSTSGDTIPEGTVIRVDRIEGVKVFVSKAEVTVTQ